MSAVAQAPQPQGRPRPAGTAAPAPAARPPQEMPAPAPTSGAPTPALIVRRMVLAAAVTAVFGLVTVWSMFSGAAAMHAASANTSQLVRVQTIQSQLLRADALATNAFLVGGQESREQRATYDDAIATADRLIVEAAEAQPADRAALAALNDQVVQYVGLMEQARANNRQGLPVGAAYLSEASKQLRADAMPILDALVTANDARVNSEADGVSIWPAVLMGLVTLGVLLWIMRWTGRRFRRRLNVGLTAAFASILAAVLLAVFTASSANQQVASINDESLQATRAAAATGTAVFDAKAYESLTLVARGSGAAFEKSWQAASASAARTADEVPQANGGATLVQDVARYQQAHTEIRKLDDGGDWDAAVAAATDPDGASNATVTAIGEKISGITGDQGEAARAQLARQAVPLQVVGVLALLAGLGAAVLAIRGLNQRLKEYR